MQCKILDNNEDYNKCRNLLKISSVQQSLYPCPTILALSNYYFDTNESLYKVLGLFDEDTLVSCIFIRFSNNKRHWLIEYALSTGIEESLITLLDFTLSYTESCNYYTWHAAYFYRHDLPWERFMQSSEKFKRYISTTDEIIPSRKKSSFSEYWVNHQKYIMHPHPMIIKTYTLQEQYRIFN